MAKGFSPLIGLAVVVALAMVAVFGAMSLTNPAFAAVGAPADAELAERTFSPQRLCNGLANGLPKKRSRWTSAPFPITGGVTKRVGTGDGTLHMVMVNAAGMIRYRGVDCCEYQSSAAIGVTKNVGAEDSRPLMMHNALGRHDSEVTVPCAGREV